MYDGVNFLALQDLMMKILARKPNRLAREGLYLLLGIGGKGRFAIGVSEKNLKYIQAHSESILVELG